MRAAYTFKKSDAAPSSFLTARAWTVPADVAGMRRQSHLLAQQNSLHATSSLPHMHLFATGLAQGNECAHLIQVSKARLNIRQPTYGLCLFDSCQTDVRLGRQLVVTRQLEVVPSCGNHNGVLPILILPHQHLNIERLVKRNRYWSSRSPASRSATHMPG